MIVDKVSEMYTLLSSVLLGELLAALVKILLVVISSSGVLRVCCCWVRRQSGSDLRGKEVTNKSFICPNFSTV